MSKTVAAILISDIHLSDNPPAARAAEPDWFTAMARPLAELDALKSEYNCPVICGGDVFDHWRPSPGLLEFAIQHLPVMYAVPGQHDLPNHRYGRRKESGYGVLCAAGRIHDLFAQEGRGALTVYTVGGLPLHLYGAPWGYQPVRPHPPMKHDTGRGLNIAVCHRYIWTVGAVYPGGDATCNNINAYHTILKGYDVALFGDNHKGFVVEQNGCTIVNAGNAMRRHRDDQPPGVWLLHVNGDVEPHLFDTTADIVAPVAKPAPAMSAMLQTELKAFVEGLAAGGDVFDFRLAVRRFVVEGDLTPDARKLLLESVGL